SETTTDRRHPRWAAVLSYPRATDVFRRVAQSRPPDLSMPMRARQHLGMKSFDGRPEGVLLPAVVFRRRNTLERAMFNRDTKAWLSLSILAIVMGLLLFVPAGTVGYWQAWIYLTIFIGISALVTRHLMRHDPALLERRLRGGPTAERRPVQKVIMLCTSIG